MNIAKSSQTLTTGGTSIPPWKQLRWNLVAFAVILALVPVLIVGVVVLQQTRTQTLTQINRQLESVTTLKENELQRWLGTSNQIIDVFVSDRARYSVLTQFITSAPEAQAVTRDGVNTVLQNGIKAQTGTDTAFKEFFLYDLKGQIVASSDDAQVGKIVGRQPYFKPSLEGNYLQTPYYDISSTELTMFISRPLKSTSGDVIGVIAGRLDLTTLNNIMTERVGLGDTGETYLVSIENNYFITASRFENIDQNRAYHTEGIDTALSGKDGFGIYPDYRNVSVIGIYRWVPDLKAAFLAEIDESEAFTLYNESLTFGTIVLVLAALGATLIAFYNATRVSRPISTLTNIASQIANGDLNERATVKTQNEIGVLASTFNSMADQLQNLVGTLEDRVNARTRDLQIVANVSKSATTILNLNDLLQAVVDLTKQSFDLYHAHIYLLDEAGENLVLTAGAGEPGRIMKAEGRRIALNNPSSLVARAGRTRKGVIENDVTQAPDFLPNPLLPNTQSELAVPMVIGNRLIGVLDVQADYANRFTEEDVAVQTSLSDQIAIAVQNASSFQVTQAALEKTEILYAGSARVNRATSLHDVLTAIMESTALKQVDRATILFFDRPWTDVLPNSMMRAAEWSKDGSPSPIPLGTVYQAEQFPILRSFKRDEPLIFSDVANDLVNDPNARHVLLDVLGVHSMVVYSLITNDQWIGVIAAESHELTFLNDEQVRHISALVAQAANVIGNINLVEQTQKRATELETVAKVSAAATSILDVNELLQSVVDLTKEAFDLYHAHIYLLDETGEKLVLTAGAGEPGRTMKQQGRSISINHHNSLVAHAGRERTGVISNDVTKEPEFLPNPLLPNTKSEMAVPLVVGNKLVGVLDVQADVTNRFSNDDLAIQETLAAQIAVAVENARAFADVQAAEEQIRASQEELLEAQRIARVGRWTWVPATGAVGWNDMMYEHFGESHTVEPTFEVFLKHVHPEDAPHLVKTMEDAIQNGASGFTDEYRVIRSDGSIRYHSAIGGITRDASGAATNLVGTAQDITDRKGAEAERQIVYEAASRLNEAQNREQLLEAVLPYAQYNGISSANMLYVDVDSSNQPEWAELVAEWSSTGKTTTPLGSRFYLPEFPISKLWMSSSHEPLLIGDLNSSPILDETTRGIMKATGVQAMAILPVVTQGRWLAFMSFSWPQVVQFSDQDRRIYTSIMQQATATIDALRSAEETEMALKQTEILYAGGERVNHANTLSEVLTAVIESTALKQVDRATLLFFDRPWDQEIPTSITRIAEWSQDGTPSPLPLGTVLPASRFPIMHSFKRGEPIIYRDVANDLIEDPNARDLLLNTLHVQSLVIYPLVTNDQWIGVIVAESHELSHFNDEDIRYIGALVAQGANVIGNIRLLEETESALRKTEALYTGSERITSAVTIDDALKAFVESTDLRFYDVASLLVYDQIWDNTTLPNTTTRIAEWTRNGQPSGIPNGTVYPLDSFPIFKLLKRDDAFILNDATTNPNIDENTRHLLTEIVKIKSMVVYPLVASNQWYGALTVQSKELGVIDEEQARHITALVGQIANVIQNIRLGEQTRKRAAELETVAQVSAATTSILDMNDMLLAVTDLTKDSFGLYHAHVYLLDDSGQNLVLAAGAGEPGRIMKAEGRSIPINHPNSLVAHAASTREGTIANDVTQAPDFLANPLLPNTKSEMAVPMVVGDKLVGILDVQSDIINRFSEDDVRIQSTLADQIAVAVENARAFAHVASANEEVSRIFNLSVDMIGTAGFDGYFRSVNPAWEKTLGWTSQELTTAPFVSFVHEGDRQRTLDEYASEMAAGKSTISFENRYMCKDGSFRWLSWNAVPFIQENVTYFVARDVTAQKQQEEEQNVLYGLSSAMNNARTQADVLAAMTSYAAMRGANSASLFHIDIEEGVPTWIENVANETDGTIPTVDVGSRYYLPEFQMAKIWLADPTKPLLINDIATWEQSDPTAYTIMKQMGTGSIAVVPLFAQDRWVGLMTFSWHGNVEFTAQDERIFTSAMRQATSTVDALRASALTAKRAAELQTVAQVSAAATMVLEVESLLQSVVDLAKESFDLYHAHIYLMDDAGENLVLTAGAGEPGRIMKEQGRSISVHHQNSLVARAARSRDGAIANDVTLEPDFLPNPLLPDTRSEMAIPLIVGDDVIGVLDVQANTINRFTGDDVSIQSTLADQVAVAVQNARAFKMTQETAERLREVDRLKSQFLANMSHELRTPLNSIIGYAEVLLDGIDGDLTDEAVEDVQAIHGGGKHLLTIINDILDLAKIEAGQMFMDRQDANLNQAVDEVVNTCQILAKNKDIGLNVEFSGDIPHVFGDPIRLKQIIFNLVNNAIKFTEKGAVTVNLGMTDDNTQVVVAVHDSGMGMTEEDMAGLFQQFHQVDGSATRRAGGTGLGLVITRHLVQMHEGEIYVESEKGTGSTFWFTLPVYSNQPRQKA